MTAFPHQYSAQVTTTNTATITVNSDPLPPITTEAPQEFGGSGEHWSPETLLMAAIADCFGLSFQSISNASRFKWIKLTCEVEGILDQVDRTIQFTQIAIQANLRLPADEDEKRAMLLLNKAKRACFITNSLAVEVTLDAHVSKETPAKAVSSS